MFLASGVRPNSSVPEVFQTLSRFRSEDDSTGHVPWPAFRLNKRFGVALSQFHRPLPVCITSGVNSDRQVERQTLLSTWTVQQRLTKDSCHR